jgi:membrane protein implicated in regulation of membrane protease activity
VAGIDEYTLKARICPVLLIAALPGIALAFLFPEMDWKTVTVPPTALVALALAAAAFSRDQGKRREPQLFESWGGMPTTVMLRYRSKTFPERQLAHLHKFLAKVTHNTIPTAKREEADPAGADVVYESLTRYLREATRDKKQYPFVFRELTHYGFLRNLWGLRGTGIVFAIVALIVTGVWLAFSGPWAWNIPCLAPAVNVLAIILWAWWPDRTAVRHGAESYASALLTAGFKLAEAEPESE